MTLPRTASQTVGPFFSFGLTWPVGPHVVPADTPGAIYITGRLLDGNGNPVPDGLIETWQAGPDGRYPRAGAMGDAETRAFSGYGRAATDAQGRYEIWTLKPGAVSVPGADGVRHAPHIAVSVFARGLLRRLVTRLYFPDEETANAVDPALAAVPDAAARATLIAARAEAEPGNESGAGRRAGYRFDIRLQGSSIASSVGSSVGSGATAETVFFDV